MPSYLLQVSYSAEAWAAMIKHPQDRIEAVRKSVEKLGGKIINGWLSFGDYDIVALLDMPDNVFAAAFAMAAAAGGACKNVQTPPLLSIDEVRRRCVRPPPRDTNPPQPASRDRSRPFRLKAVVGRKGVSGFTEESRKCLPKPSLFRLAQLGPPIREQCSPLNNETH